MTMKCGICGEDFEIKPYEVKRGGRFCSLHCSMIFRHRQKNIKMINKTCKICGKIFLINPYKEKTGKGLFCSVRCKSNHQTKPNDSKCLICGKEFKAGLTYKKIGWGKFCSVKCTGVWRSKTIRGEKVANWKGGITPDRQKIQGSIKYREWRNQIFKRDNFTCQKCGDNRGGNLHAHHKKRFAVILNDIQQQYPLLPMADIADTYPDLWDISNGITLCKQCHRQEHKRKP